MGETVRTERRGPVLEIVLSRPDKRNAIDGEMAAELFEAWARLGDDDVRAGVLAADGPAFCAGADLEALETLGPGDGFQLGDPEREAFVSGEEGYLGPTRQPFPPVPVIAAVQGPALAGGLELTCLCDLRVAGEEATFGATNREWGVPLVDGGSQRLPRIVGLGRALELVLTGRVLRAEHAAQIGLVNDLVPEGGERTRAGKIADRITQLPQDALRADRRSVYEGMDRPMADGLEIEARNGQEVVEAEGFEAGPRRFALDE
ncbi:enoyl-CoA hydratase [Thermoplasmatales archaeon SW_10_69_26]|nr:MAG: enoyl-CoA hydratase [Thermoplasmatales archaeon SW_10_69_26]